MMRPQRTSRHRMVAAGLLSGGAAGLLLLAPSIADAAGPLADVFGQTTPPTTEPADDSADDAATAEDSGGDDEITIGEPGDHLREMLQPLVDDGTITGEQLDAIIASVDAAAPEVFIEALPPIFSGGHGGPGRPDGPHGPGFPGGGIEVHGPGIDVEIGEGAGPHMFPVGPGALDLVANTIGITAPDLLDQLADGSTVAEIASAAGADPQAVIDALVADVQERLSAAVQSGRITQAVADQRLEDATERITGFVNGEEPSADEAGSDEGTQEGTDASTETTDTTTA